MTTATHLVARPRERAVRAGLAVLGIVSLAIAALQAFAPATFVEHVGPFGDVNAHYVRDVATWYAAAGVVLLLAVGRPAWRVPVLVLVLVQGVFHLVNHVIDIGEADPGWVGPGDALMLLAMLAVTWWLLVAARREEGR